MRALSAVLFTLVVAVVPTTARAQATIDYATQILPLFSHCVGCHGLAGGLSLAGDPYARLVNVPAHSSSRLRVKPGDAAHSELYRRVRSGMGGLRPNQIAAIKGWIDEGAPPAVVGPQITEDATATPNPALTSDVVAFSVAASGDGTLTYAWDFGDGGTDTGDTPSHTFAAAGAYFVTVIVSDGTNQVKSGVTVQVNAPNPSGLAVTSPADAFPQPAEIGSPASFSVAATADVGTLTYAWDFGDGTTGSGDTVEHAYAAAGDYVATVTVSNGTDTATSKTAISVIPLGTLTVVALRGRTRFTTSGHDHVSLVATVPVLPAGFEPIRKWATVDVGAVTSEFTVDDRDRGTSDAPRGRFKLTRGHAGGPAVVRIELTGNFASAWAQYGLDPSASARDVPFTLPLQIGLIGRHYATASTRHLTVVAHKRAEFR